MPIDANSPDFLGLTSQIVSAHVANNSVAATDLPALIALVHRSLASLGSAVAPVAAVAEPKAPAVSVKKSITPGYLICLEDGKKLKMLKRHLNTSYGMTPDQYRAKWGLAKDYPMVAPDYAARRSAVAKATGLGQRKKAD